METDSICEGVYYYDHGTVTRIKRISIYNQKNAIICVCPSYAYYVLDKGGCYESWTTHYAGCRGVFMGGHITVDYRQKPSIRYTLREEQTGVLIKPGRSLFINEKEYYFQNEQGEYV